MTPERKPSFKPPWKGAAFVVEAMLLLFFLVGALALFTRLFALSVEQSAESRELTMAVAAAGDVAERFAADPGSVPASATEGDLTVTCEVTDEQRPRGVYHKAEIRVRDKAGEEVYALTTGVYEGGEI
jgi:hypothetical protein